MADNFIEVELIANPLVKRLMSPQSLRDNKDRWRAVGQIDSPAPPEKKNPVEPVDNGQGAGDDYPVQEPSAQDLVQDPPLPPEFASVPAIEGQEELSIEALRAAYFEKYGIKPDTRWGISRLTKQLNG